MAPPSKLTEDTRNAIVERLASGCTLEVAAEAAGVHRVTVQEWLKIGREAEAIDEDGGKLNARQRECLELLREEQTARAGVRVKALAAIQKAGLSGTWQASAWLLERMFPEEYAAQKRSTARPGTGRPKGASSAPDRVSRPGVLRAVK